MGPTSRHSREVAQTADVPKSNVSFFFSAILFMQIFRTVRGSVGIERRSMEPRPDSFAQPPLRPHVSITLGQPLFPGTRRRPRVVDNRSPVALLPMQANGFPWRLVMVRRGAHGFSFGLAAFFTDDSDHFPFSSCGALSASFSCCQRRCRSNAF